MSETQSEIDELVAEFDTVERGDSVRLTTDDGGFDCRVCTASKTDERAELFLRRSDDATVHVWTEWVDGWLDPLVDVLPATADEGRRPVGSLLALTPLSRIESERQQPQ